MLANAVAVVAAALTLAVIPPPAAAPLASPGPSPSAAPSASPGVPPPSKLKTIATVRASARCAAIITHANSAISGALSDDQIIGQTITRLRMTNLDDGNPMDRKKGLDALGDLAKNLMMQARSSDNEVKRLRALAKASKDPAEAKALKQFADELGGALWRQQKIARDLNGFLAYQDFREMSKFNEGERQMNDANFGVPDPLAQEPRFMQVYGPQGQPEYAPPPHLGHDPNTPTATQQAKWAADDFQQRTKNIMFDENDAAGKVDGAIQGC